MVSADLFVIKKRVDGFDFIDPPERIRQPLALAPS
jgi:hypothetical protein